MDCYKKLATETHDRLVTNVKTCGLQGGVSPLHVCAIGLWSGEAGKLEASFNQLLSATLQGEHDADTERVSQREHTERGKYGDDSGSAVIEDLSEFGGTGGDYLPQPESCDDSDTDEDAFGDDASFVSAVATVSPSRPRDHLTWARGAPPRTDNDHGAQPWNAHYLQQLATTNDSASLVVALKSLERTLQTHCKLLNRRIKKDKSNSNSASPGHHGHGHTHLKEPPRDQKSRAPSIPKSPMQLHVHRNKVSMMSGHEHA